MAVQTILGTRRNLLRASFLFGMKRSDAELMQYRNPPSLGRSIAEDVSQVRVGDARTNFGTNGNFAAIGASDDQIRVNRLNE